MKGILNQSGRGLDHLIEQTQLYQALLDLAHQQLPPRLAEHLIGVSFEAQTLILQADNPAWVSKLRFYEVEILSLYQTHFPHLTLNQVKFKTLPISERTKPKKVPMAKPDKDTGAAFFHLSEQVSSPKLKSVLQRLGERAFEK